MLAILFTIVCILFGYELVSYLVPDTRRLFLAVAPSKKVLSSIPDFAFKLPAGAIVGISIITAVTYYISLGYSYVLTRGQTALLAGVTTSTVVFLYLTFMFFGFNRKAALKQTVPSKAPEFDSSILNILVYGISIVAFTCIAAFLYFYTFKISNGILENGYSVFSDLAPHTAMTSSFGVGSNFPTQYMHFSGDGIQYHFFFYFFCGILEYLGLPIDYAINVPSIIAMVCAFCLLGLLAVLLSGRKMTFIIAPLLVLFRSAFNVFDEIKAMHNFGYSFSYSLKVLASSTSWFDNTPYDSWGIWSINVYANQRHLMFGVSMIIILVILFIPYVRRLCISLMNSKNVFKTYFIARNTWLPRKNDPVHPIKNLILAVLIVIFMPYIHGSALIAALLILFGMAIFSENRLSYLIVAIVSVISSFIQTRIFSGNFKDFVLFNHVTGFVSNTKDFSGMTKYLIYITGFTLVIALMFAIGWLIKDIIYKKPIYRSLLVICFMLPLIFAFNVQVSLEMLANHKFIQITLILVDIFVATAISNLLVLPVKLAKKEVILPTLLPLDNDEVDKQMEAEGILGSTEKKGIRLPLPAFIPAQVLSVLIAIFLIIGLTGTGIAEWCTYININKNTLNLDTNSELVEWISTKTDEHDVFLTPMWFTNRFYLAGRASYYGWPYYAWSAGHDTDTREEIYCWLLSGCNGNIDEFVRYCKEREIKYLVFDPEFYDFLDENDNMAFNADFFQQNLKQVAYFPNDNNTIVYQIY